MKHKPKVRGKANGNWREGQNFARSYEIGLQFGNIVGQEWAFVYRRKDLLDDYKGHRCTVVSVDSHESLIEVEMFDGDSGTMQITKRIKNWQLKMAWTDFQAMKAVA